MPIPTVHLVMKMWPEASAYPDWIVNLRKAACTVQTGLLKEKTGVLNVMLKYRMGLTSEWLLLPAASSSFQRWTGNLGQLPAVLCGIARRLNRDKWLLEATTTGTRARSSCSGTPTHSLCSGNNSFCYYYYYHHHHNHHHIGIVIINIYHLPRFMLLWQCVINILIMELLCALL